MQDNLVRYVRVGRRFVEGILEPGDEGVDVFRWRLLRTGRRHDATTQLAYGLFEYVAMFADIGRRQALEADASGFGAVVMTADAVLVDRVQLRRGRGSLSCWSRRRGDEHASHRSSDYSGQRNNSEQCDWILCHMSHELSIR